MKMLLFCISVLLIAACNQEDILSPVLPDNDTGSETIDIEEALTGLDILIDRFAPITNTKTSMPKSYSENDISVFGAKDISTFTRSNLQIEIPDTLLYIVNFEGNNGFAVMSANRKLGSFVYCVTDKGQISSNDFSDAYALISEASLSAEKGLYDGEDYEFTSMGESFIPAIILSSAISGLENGPIVTNNNEDIDTKAIANYGLLSTRWTQSSPLKKKLQIMLRQDALQ